jgi:hypothetical protein
LADRLALRQPDSIVTIITAFQVPGCQPDSRSYQDALLEVGGGKTRARTQTKEILVLT